MDNKKILLRLTAAILTVADVVAYSLNFINRQAFVGILFIVLITIVAVTRKRT